MIQGQCNDVPYSYINYWKAIECGIHVYVQEILL